jgi:hypothetical protein
LKFIDTLGRELILANQKARDGANRLFSGMTQEERDRIQIDSSGRVTIRPVEMCGTDTPPSSSFAMVQFAVSSDTVVRVSILGKGDEVTLTNSIITNGLVGDFTVDFNNLFSRAGTAVPRTDGSWDVLVPEDGGARAAGIDGGEVKTTEMTIFNHEIAHPFGLNAIDVENNVRRENGLPLRSGSDHLDPNHTIQVTTDAIPIETTPTEIQKVITPRPLIPLPTPPKIPNE